jgi:UDP-perosamine 4-acetyltransferase
VVGGGGHAKVVIDLALACHREVSGFTAPSGGAEALLGVPRLGDDFELERLRARGFDAAVVAVGNNETRLRLTLELEQLGFDLITLIHPRAWISPFAELGGGTVAMAGAMVNAGTRTGRSVILNTGSTVDHDCDLGDAVHVAPGTHLAGYVTVGERTLLGVASSIGRGRPLSIGRDVVVGTGSTVVTDLLNGTTTYGNPAHARRGRGSA